MTHINIIHNLENLTSSQKYNLEIVENITNNLNSIRPINIIENVLAYDGKNFTIKQGGFLNRFLIDDINVTLEDNKEKHLNFIKETIKEHFKNFDYYSKKLPNELENLKFVLSSTIKYYELNMELDFPTYYRDSEFKDNIDLLKQAVEKELAKT